MNAPAKLQSVVLHVGGSESRFDATALPLRIGTDSGADVRLPGPGGRPLAMLDALDGQPFLQPVDRPSPIERDGEPLSGSLPLRDRTLVRAYGNDLEFRLDGGELHVEVRSGSSEFETAPPLLPETAEDSEDIVAVGYQRRAAGGEPARRRRVWPWLVAAGIGVLAAIGIGLSTSVSVRFDTVPAVPDSISVSGVIAIPVADRWLLRPGVHEVTLRSRGYEPLTRRIDVARSQTRFTLEQTPLPGRLHVTVDETASAVARLRAADGEVVERPVPGIFESVMPGAYTLEVRSPRFLPWSGDIDIAGLDTDQVLDVDLVPNFARVSVVTEPPGAAIFAGAGDDPRQLGVTPATVELVEGRHELSLLLDGYQPASPSLTVFADTDVSLPPIELQPANGRLTVVTRPAGASVTVDGRFRGLSPVRLALVPERQYTVAMSRAGYGRVTRNVRLPAAADERLVVDLAARSGELTIRAIPADATIFINGREAGVGTVTRSLPAEPQLVTVKRSGYVDWQQRVTPRAGLTQTVDARMVSLDEARLAGIQQQVRTKDGYELRYVEGGRFRMGSSRREPGRRANESYREVLITRPFYIGVREVTNREFAAFRRNHDSGAATYPALVGDNNPVVNVSWQDAAAYCNELSEKEGLTPAYRESFGKLVPVVPMTDGYRLPTEAEWAWVARFEASGTARKFPWGEDMPPTEGSGNFADQSAIDLVPTVLPKYRDGYPATAPVGSFRPNALGIYDLGGNAAEWIHDYYATSPGSEDVARDPLGAERGTHHVIRGSSWRDAGLTQLRLSYRDFGITARDDIGFRVARYADAPPRSE